jgi:hypothetical protein
VYSRQDFDALAGNVQRLPDLDFMKGDETALVALECD